MRAIICDKCGVMWKDERNVEDKVKIETLEMRYKNNDDSYPCGIYSYDLCEKCRSDLFDFLDDKKV